MPDQTPIGRAEPELEVALARVARVRGREFLRRPLLVRVPRAELVQHALAWLHESTPERTRRAEAALLRALELVPADFGWDGALRVVLAARLSAFYDSRRGTIWLDDALAAASRRRVLAHELVHVLADQHHALGARLASPTASADARAALLAVAEGDAEVLVQELEAAGLLAPDDASTGAPGVELPGVIERSLAAAYVDGHALVRRVYEAGGWAEVDALYAAPPPSTHALGASGVSYARSAPPASDRPPPPALAPAGDGWSRAFDETLGERAWRVILEEWTGAPRAFEVASGWRSDRLLGFEQSPRRALMWEIHADDATASAAESVLRGGLRLPAPSTASRRASTGSCRAHRDGGALGLWRRGRRLLIGAWSDVPARVGCASLTEWIERLAATDSTP